MWPSKFVPRVMKAGGRGCFDTVALNAYAPTGKGVVKLVSQLPQAAEPAARAATSACA